MKSNRDKYLSQKGITVKTRDKIPSAAGNAKKELSSLEKLVIILLLVFLAAIPLSYLINKDIMVYVGLINYLILGIAITIKPEHVINIMSKNKGKADEVYEKRIKKLTMYVRIMGLLFVAIGVALFYFLILQP